MNIRRAGARRVQMVCNLAHFQVERERETEAYVKQTLIECMRIASLRVCIIKIIKGWALARHFENYRLGC
jgi:hypothetical protein